MEDFEAEPMLASTYTITTGALFSQVCLVFASNVQRHCVKLYTQGQLANLIESVTIAGPLSMRTELITRFVSTSEFPTTLFTDDEGLEMHSRVLRLDHQYVGGNYHACVACCIMNGTDASIAVLTRQSFGIASLYDGSLEVMLHRRVNTSDSQGIFMS